MKKESIKISLFYVMLTLLLASFQSCDKDSEFAYHVSYEVSGHVTFVSYFTPSGEQSQYGVSSPWSYNFSTSNKEQNISLRAGSGGGAVYVKVYLNGKLILSDTESNGLTAITGTYKISDFL